MASGCAVISSIPLEFEGIHLSYNGTSQLIEAIQSLWADPEAIRRMGRRNVEMAQAYTWDEYGANLTAVYEEVLQKNEYR